MSLSKGDARKAMYTRLDNDATLQGIVADRIYDLNNVPDRPIRPYIVVGEIIATPKDTLTNTGSDIVVMLHSWSQQRTQEEIEAIQNAMYGALDRKEDAITALLIGHKCNDCRLISNNILKDSSSGEKLLHGVDRYRIWTEAI